MLEEEGLDSDPVVDLALGRLRFQRGFLGI